MRVFVFERQEREAGVVQVRQVRPRERYEERGEARVRKSNLTRTD